MTAFDHRPTRRAMPGILALILMLGVWLPACAAQDKAQGQTQAEKPADPNEVLAKVDGKPITRAQVMADAAEQFKQLEMQLTQCQSQYEKNKHDLVEQSVEQSVRDRMVEAEAKAKGVTPEQLLADAVKPAEVTDAEVDAFYEENKAQIPRPKEQVAPQIKQYLAQQRQSEARETFYASLGDKYKAEYLIEPMRVEVAATGPGKGPENAPVTIVEFSDFECPFCSRVNPTLDKVKQTYGDKVRIVFRQFPLAMHPNAQKAAEASLCANDQGKFWEMHDAMFADQRQLAVDSLKTKATQLGLNAEQFNQCLDSNKYAPQVQADLQAGAEAGVSGTPAAFINGRFLSGAQPYENFAKIIDDELRRKGVKTAAN